MEQQNCSNYQCTRQTKTEKEENLLNNIHRTENELSTFYILKSNRTEKSQRKHILISTIIQAMKPVKRNMKTIKERKRAWWFLSYLALGYWGLRFISTKFTTFLVWRILVFSFLMEIIYSTLFKWIKCDYRWFQFSSLYFYVFSKLSIMNVHYLYN